MNSKQENKLSMYRAVKKVLDKFRERWSTMPGFVRAANSFFAQIVSIEQTGANQEKPITGIATDKQDAREKLVNAALLVAGSVHAYAFSTGNDELAASVDFNRTGLLRERDETLVQTCMNIRDAAAEHLPALEEWGVTPPLMTGLNNAIEEFHAIAPQTRTAISERSTYTDALAEEFEKTDLILTGQLDRLMLHFKRPETTAGAAFTDAAAPASRADFYELYFQAREIIDLGKRTFHQETVILKAGEMRKVDRVVSGKPAKNTGHTTLTWRPSGNDEPRIIEPGQEVTLLTPDETVELHNTDETLDGKILITRYKRDAFERD